MKIEKHHIIYINHIGFLTDSRKRLILDDLHAEDFEIQDMAVNVQEEFGKYENWKAVYKGKLIRRSTDMGVYLTGDFSGLNIPGVYRILIPGTGIYSRIFVISDGAYSLLPDLIFNFIHIRRSGEFNIPYRGPSHLDDGLRNDTKEPYRLLGGWYDAGDLRKWMTHANYPIFGLLDFSKRNEFSRSSLSFENVSNNDWITESAWAVNYILSMQDKESGRFFEEIGGGGEARRHSGMSWWYENHSGCYADNSQNYFSDNKPGSGDERIIRTDYNPIVQYVSISLICRFAYSIEAEKPELSKLCRESASKAYSYVNEVMTSDPLHKWTSVKAWRLSAQLALYENALCGYDETIKSLTDLEECYNKSTGFFMMYDTGTEPYRGIVHSAQPLLALCEFADTFPESTETAKVKNVLENIINEYVIPLTGTNPFGIVPYGLFLAGNTAGDFYRNWKKGYFYRFFMPDHSPQKINHGLSGHWTQWAYALSYCSDILSKPGLKENAWDQLYWLFGGNPLDSCLVSGIGYNNPMPHSRFFGTIPGGFMIGPRGTDDDKIWIDMDNHAEWNTTEYWNYPAGNALQAFHRLFPKQFRTEKKLCVKNPNI